MGFNGAGVWVYSTSGVPFVSGTVISSTVMNNLDTEIGTGFSTCIARDGQSVTTARINFLFGIASTLTTDSTSSGTGSIITSGGVGIAKALWVAGLANIAGFLTVQSAMAATVITSTADLIYLGGTTSSNVLLTRSGPEFQVKLGDSSALAGIRGAYFQTDSSIIYIGGTTSSEVSLRRSTTQLKVRLGNDSNDADLSCGVLTATTANATTVATTNLTATGTIDLGGQDYSGLLAGITNITIVKGVVTFTS